MILSSLSYSQNKQDTLYVAAWNIENLFDTIDDPDKRDEDFLPDGKKEWSQEKIDKKIEHLAEVIASMNNGNGPSILGVTEVEHQHLLDTMLVRHFRNKNYECFEIYLSKAIELVNVNNLSSPGCIRSILNMINTLSYFPEKQ